MWPLHSAHSSTHGFKLVKIKVLQSSVIVEEPFLSFYSLQNLYPKKVYVESFLKAYRAPERSYFWRVWMPKMLKHSDRNTSTREWGEMHNIKCMSLIVFSCSPLILLRSNMETQSISATKWSNVKFSMRFGDLLQFH